MRVGESMKDLSTCHASRTHFERKVGYEFLIRGLVHYQDSQFCQEQFTLNTADHVTLD